MRLIAFIIVLTITCGFAYSSPQISITQLGEQSVSLGKIATYSIIVENHSSTPVSNIVVKSKPPSGFKYRQRDTGKFILRWNIKTLHAKEKRYFQYSLQTTREGQFTSKTLLYMGSQKRQEIHFNIVVAKPQIALALSCPGIASPVKRVRVDIVVKNTGNVNLYDVVLKSTSDSSYYILAGEGNPKITTNLATWNVGHLSARETKSYAVTVICKNCGKHCFTATVNSSEGAHAQSVCCTRWLGCRYLLLEVIDTVDPLVVDDKTTYLIEVTNQNTISDHNVKIEVVFPEEISPIRAQGDTKCTVNDKRVTVIPFPVLRPKEKIKWEIHAKAVKPGGARIKVYLISSMFRKPICEEVSTHVY